MSNHRTRKTNRTSVWVAIAAIFLIILLIIWLTFADLTGNTDVAAFIAPYIVKAPVGWQYGLHFRSFQITNRQKL